MTCGGFYAETQMSRSQVGNANAMRNSRASPAHRWRNELEPDVRVER